MIDAAKDAEVELLVYTSLLHADGSELFLAREHKQTEEYIRASGLRFVILRNGCYMENHTSALASAVEHGALIGSSGEGRFASAARADYAAAAVAVLTEPTSGNNIYELAGNHSFSMAELADEVSTQIGRDIPYRNLSSEAYAAMLLGLGLSQMVTDVMIDASLFETGFSIGLKYSEGFTRLWPSIATAMMIALNLGLVGVATRSMPLGTAYAVWTGIGSAGTVAVGIVLFGESAAPGRLACLGLILTGIIGLKLVGE